jgi:hypothetical protein
MGVIALPYLEAAGGKGSAQVVDGEDGASGLWGFLCLYR